jgi:hypothetical protein
MSELQKYYTKLLEEATKNQDEESMEYYSSQLEELEELTEIKITMEWEEIAQNIY